MPASRLPLRRLSLEAFPHKVANDSEFFLARDGVPLVEFPPDDIETRGFENLHLLLYGVEWDHWVNRAVGDQEPLFAGNGRKLLQRSFLVMRVATKPNQARQPVWITQSGLPGHQAAL